MTKVFNPPPNWPTPPHGWAPPTGWQPDPAWGPVPAGWLLWLEADRVGARHEYPSLYRIFISYRRSDCQPQANGLYDGLSHRLRSSKVFMDLDSIPPGVEFEKHIRDEIRVCDLVLVLIGDNWLDRTGPSGTRRIDEPDDFVRLEIEIALELPQVRVLPVLVEGAPMPQPANLPPSIQRLARINAIELSDRRWTADLERLTQAIERLRGEKDARLQREGLAAYETTHWVPARQVEPPVQTGDSFRGEPERARRSGTAPHGGASTHPVGVAAQGPATQPKALDPRSGAGAHAARSAKGNRTSVAGWVMIFLPIVTFGLVDFVPALWSITQRRHDLRFRRLMIAFAVAAGAASYIGLFLLGSAPTNDGGTPAGARSDIGTFLWVLSMLAATIVAVFTRKAKPMLPGAAEELARRGQRKEYRALIQRDIDLARAIGVGRPDLKRDYDDGGLLDLNALSAQALLQFGHLSTDEAQRVVEARRKLTRFSSAEDVAIHANLPESVVAKLREVAVFL